MSVSSGRRLQDPVTSALEDGLEVKLSMKTEDRRCPYYTVFYLQVLVGTCRQMLLAKSTIHLLTDPFVAVQEIASLCSLFKSAVKYNQLFTHADSHKTWWSSIALLLL